MTDEQVHYALDWVDRGCDPTDLWAPSIYRLMRLEADDLLQELNEAGKPIRYLLTDKGHYELTRLRSRK